MASINMPSTERQQDLLRSERIAGGILPRILTSFDMVAIVVAVILWIPNAAIATGAGATAYVYWGVGFMTFLIPGAIVTGQLGLMFPREGSIYVWTTKAFGNFMGFLAGFCAWWPGILSMIAAGVVVVAMIQQLGNRFGVTILQDPGVQGLVIIGVLTLSFVLSILRFRTTQNIVNIVFVAYMGAIVLVGIAGVLWLLTGHHANADLSWQLQIWLPGTGKNTFYGTVILALLGIEVPLNMGVEIRDVRSITRYLLWGSIVVMIAYLIATFGVMVAVPLKDQGNPAGIAEAILKGFGPVGIFFSIIVDLIFIGFFVIVVTVYNYSFGRLIFVSGLDRRLPAVISKVSMNRVPWVATLAQTIIGISLTAIIFVVAPLLLKSAEPTTLIYDLLQASTSVVWCISMVLLFLDVLIIRHRYAPTFSRIHLTSRWLLYICSILGILASFCGAYVIFTSPWTNALTTLQWDVWIACIAIFSLIVAVIGFYIGRRTIKNDLSDEAIITEVTG